MPCSKLNCIRPIYFCNRIYETDTVCSPIVASCRGFGVYLVCYVIWPAVYRTECLLRRLLQYLL